MSDITIYHNPDCGTSRNVLGLIRNTGVEPRVIEYLKHPPDRASLCALIAAMGGSVRDLLRLKSAPRPADAGRPPRGVSKVAKQHLLKSPPGETLDLADPKWTDEQLIDFMLLQPLLINRPIVVTPLGTRLCRPSETVLAILPKPQQGVFTKEDGQAVVDAGGRHV